ncbi:MAG: hypothetical protein HQ518_05435 [Rhodopirellula sp.]|nr:hypothetical protein [Rhodopirellula sp.]
MNQDSLKCLLSQLSIKWKKLDSIDFNSREELDWLFDHGLIEGGLDVLVHGMTCGESFRQLYVVSGQGWHENTNMQAISDAALHDKEVGVQTGSHWAYLRLTPTGVEQKRSDVLPDSMVAFRIEQVDCFEELATDEDRERLAEDEKLRLYFRTNIKEAFRELKPNDLAFTVKRDGIKQRVTLAEYTRLGLGFSAEHIVVGQQHESIQRDLIAILWPDLAEPIELDGSIDAYTQASQRLQNWTGVAMPFCHRDWRALSEWAGLEPEEITDDWLDSFLVPRLRVLWFKRKQTNHSPPAPPESPPNGRKRKKPGRASEVNDLDLKILEIHKDGQKHRETAEAAGVFTPDGLPDDDRVRRVLKAESERQRRKKRSTK